MAVPRLLVVGGNGYLGSAVCKAAVSRGWSVSSMSSSGAPYKTPAGHTPKWVHDVDWNQASAFEPTTYDKLVGSSSAVVHTLGILLEDTGYKRAVRDGDVLGVARAIVKGVSGNGNPLKTTQERRTGYEGMNKDSAVTVLDTMLSTPPTPAGVATSPSRSFVYVSCANSILPFVPERYVTSKREAEAEIERRCVGTDVHPIIMRPGLMYNAHVRPLSTLPAFALSLTAGLNDRLRLDPPFKSDSFLGRAAENLATHPIHVDHVADAIIKSLAQGKEGVVDVPSMRRWAGFDVPDTLKPSHV